MPVYRPWRYGNRQDVRERDVRDFRQNAAYYEEQQQAAPKRDTTLPIDRVREGKSKKSSNPLKKLGGGIKDIAEDAGELGKKAGGLALKVLDAPTEYVGKPGFGVVSGLTRSEVFTDPETGQRYRKTASFKDVGESLVAAAKNPLDAYREGKQATEEYLADPKKSAIQRGVTRAAIDPLSYVGPGLAAKGVKAAGLGGKTGRVAYELLESGGPGVVLGGNVAGEAEATYGDEIPGWNKLPKTGRVIAASVAGGVAGGAGARQIAKGRVGLSIENKPEGKHSVVRSSIDPARSYEFRYRLVDLEDLVVSHDPWSMAENPAYAREIQPRNRGSAAGKLQVEGMAQNLDPQKLLAETGDLQNGIPIIGGDGIVESGNGRTMATIRAAQDHPDVYAEYVRQLSEKLPEFGIPREEIANMSRPYLVRERLTDVDRAAFGAEANGASTLRMGTVETAMADAKMIPDELIHNLDIPEGATLDQVIGSPRSAEFVRSFMNRLPENERAALMDANGNLNAAGMQRLKAAFFAKTYGGEAGQRLLADFFESPDPSVRNVRQGMEASLPAVAQMEAGVRAGQIAAEFSVADDIASAADAFARIKSGTLKFKTIGDYLSQSSMFGDEMQLNPRAREFLKFMDEHNRAPKQMREALRGYSESVMALPPPNQADLFGGTGPGRTFAEMWEKATGEIMPEEVVSQTGLPMGQGAVNVGGEPIPPSPVPDIAQPSKTIADQSLPGSTETPAPRSADTNVVNESNPSTPRPTDTSSELPRDASAGSEGRSIPESVAPEGRLPRPEGEPPTVPARGLGTEGRGRPTGGIGGRIEEPPGLPPEGPPREPPMGDGKGGTRPFGEQPDIDLFNMPTREETLRRARVREGALAKKVGNKVASELGKLVPEEVRTKVDPFIRQANEIAHKISHTAEWMITRERAVLRASGIELKKADDGAFHLFADGRDVGLAEDVIEQLGSGKAAYDSLTDLQKDALGVIREHNTLLNGNTRFHGGEVRIDPEIEGDYFGRRVIARKYDAEGGPVRIEKAEGMVQSRKVGAERTKSRVIESAEKLQEMGFELDDPWVARLAIARGKLMTAEDAYLAKNLTPLQAKDAGSTLGLTSVSGHPAFNNQWYTPEVAKRIQKGLDAAERGTPERFIAEVNSVLTPLRASFDLSASLQQGTRLWLTDPKAAATYWWQVTKSLGDPKVFDGAVLKLDADGPGIQYLISRGLRYTGDSGVDDFLLPQPLLNRLGKAQGPAGLAGKGLAKGLTKSNEHFSRTLNLYRIHFANSQYKRLVALGLEGADLDDAMEKSMAGVNRSFGWTGTKVTTIEEAGLFAPRYTRAAVETVIKAISDGGIEGNLARQHMGLLLAEGAALVWTINTLRGYETEFDPRDPNFMRFRNVGGLDVSPFGTYNTLFRAIAGTVAGGGGEGGTGRAGQLWRFAEGKMSPGLKLVYEPFIKGETFLGEPLDPLGSPGGFAKAVKEQAKSSVPFGVQNLIQEGPLAAGIGSLGVSSTPMTPAEKRDFGRDAVARRDFGKSYEELSGADKAMVNEDPGVRKHQERVDRRALRTSGEFAQSTKIRKQVEEELNTSAQYLAAGRDDAGNPFTGKDFRNAYNDTMLRAAGARSTLNFKGGDAAVDGWFDLYKQATMPNGQVDYDKLERLQGEYRAKNPSIDEKVDRAVGVHDNAAVRQLREAKKLASEYYALPAYRGMSTEESERASQILSMANDLVSYGKARNRAAALRLLTSFDAEGVQLARRASRRGPNPARARFRKQNPLFAEFYSSISPLTTEPSG